MIKKLKHRKIRNTGLIYELLVRQLTSDVLRGNTPISLDILKKFFRKNSLLSEELRLFNTLLKKKVRNSEFASEILEAVLTARKKIDNKLLEKEKYRLIKEIKKHFDETLFFKTQVPDYPVYASIANVLEYSADENPTDYASNKITVLEYVTTPQEDNHLQNTKSLLEDVDPELQKLTFRLLTEKFNKKWGSLEEQQKEILRHYIFNSTDGEQTRKFIKENVNFLKSGLKRTSQSIDDQVIKIKLVEVSRLVSEIPSKKFVTESDFLALLRSYELLKELRNGK